MTAEEFREALEHFGLTDMAAARLFDVPAQAIRKMARGGAVQVMPSIAAEIERMYRRRLTRVRVASMVRAKAAARLAEPE